MRTLTTALVLSAISTVAMAQEERMVLSTLPGESCDVIRDENSRTVTIHCSTVNLFPKDSELWFRLHVRAANCGEITAAGDGKKPEDRRWTCIGLNPNTTVGMKPD